MSSSIAGKAGSAVFWRGLQLGATKIIFVVRLLVLAWLLTPDDFGLIAIAMVAIDLTSRLTNLGMIPALVQRENSDSVHYHTAWTVGISRAVFIALVVGLAAPLVADLFEEPRAVLIMQVLALRPLLEASASIRMADLIRLLHFKRISFVRIPEALANTLVSIALAPFWGVWALVAGSLAGPVVAIVASYLVAPYRPRLVLSRGAARSLIQFGRWIFLIGAISVAGSSVVRLIITRQLGTEALGLYYLAASLAFLPSEVSGQIVGEVTFPLYARLQTQMDRIARAFRSILKASLVILIPLTALLFAMAPGLIEHLLGSKWIDTLPLLRILVLVNIVGAVGDATVPILNGIGKPSRVAFIEAVQTTMLVGLILALSGSLGLVGVGLAWVTAVLLSQSVAVYYDFQLLKKPFAGVVGPVTVVAALSALSGLVAIGVYHLSPNLLGLVAGIAAGGGLVMVGLWRLDIRLKMGLADDLIRAYPGVDFLARFGSTSSQNQR